MGSVQSLLATHLPTSRSEPTGCRYDPFSIDIEADATRGLVPFRSSIDAVVTGGYDIIDSTCWDLDGDGFADTTCKSISPVFNDPGDHTISAWITTRSHGVLYRDVTVSAYSALMSMTFDDGSASIVTNALPLFESKGITGTAYIIPSWVDSSGYVTWEDLAVLEASGWDIGSHSMTHCRLTEVDDSTLHYELRESQLELQSRGFSAKHFSPPHFDCDERVTDAVRLYYESNRPQEGLNLDTFSTDPYSLRSRVSMSWRSLEWYLSHIDSVVATGGWYILTNHFLGGKCGTSVWCIIDQMISDIIDYALERHVRIVNLSEALEMLEEDSMDGLGMHSRLLRTPELPRAAAPARPRCWFTQAGPAVRISYQIHRQANVRLNLFSLQGEHLRTLVDGRHPAGTHSVFWDRAGDDGRRVSPGVYFFRMVAGDQRSTGKIVISR
jgi:hypothetical protein